MLMALLKIYSLGIVHFFENNFFVYKSSSMTKNVELRFKSGE